MEGEEERGISLRRLETQAYLQVDLSAIIHNWRFLRERVTPATCAAVIKADAYGLGLRPVLRALLYAGCRIFFVAHVQEGIQARAESRRLCAQFPALQEPEIFVLNGLLPFEDIPELYISHQLRPILGSKSDWEIWQRGCDRHPTPSSLPPAALHIDTGMNRLGFDVKEGAALLTSLRNNPSPFPIDMMMSHFVMSEEPTAKITRRQMDIFTQLSQKAPHSFRKSLVNSSGIFLPHMPFYDIARPGYALFGGNPTPRLPNPMRPVLSLHAPILSIREIKRGESVGYGARWRAQRPTRLAILGLGYADGIPRQAACLQTNPLGAQGVITGHFCPIVGQISMDMIALDITDVPSPLLPGALVELIGSHIDIDTLAARCGTIGYEILTHLSQRYAREYKGEI